MARQTHNSAFMQQAARNRIGWTGHAISGTQISPLLRATISERQELIFKCRQAGRNFLNTAIPLLEAQRDAAKISLYQPIADEVMGGLFARVFRFFQTFLLDYHVWAVDMGRVVLRMMLESVFYMRFLSTHNQPELYLEFQRYGIGQEKLYKMQLRKLRDEGVLKDTPDLREFIESNSDEG